MKAKNIELRYRDIDPDSGLVTTDRLIAIVDPAWSRAILDLFKEIDDPNRDFYLIEVDQVPVTVQVTEARKTDKPRVKTKESGEPVRSRQEPSAPRNNGYTPYGDFSFDNSPKTGKKKR
jgi:hypothetical protein